MKNIEEMLPTVQRIINANRHGSNQASPSDLLFGKSISLNRGIFLPTTVLNNMNISLSSWASKMLRTQETLLKKATLIQKIKDDAHIANADPRRSEFNVGSYVLVEYHSSIIRKGPANKFNTMLRGPFKVLRHEGSMYVMYDSNSRKEIEAHISTLHPFHYQSEYIDPTDVARRDVLTSFVVECVLEHTGDKTKRSTLDFLVKFTGYGDEHNLWLPYSEMRDNIKCHEYLIANNMKNLVPKPKDTSQKVDATSVLLDSVSAAKPSRAKRSTKLPQPKPVVRKSPRGKAKR